MNKYKREFTEIKDVIVNTYNHWEIWWLYKSERPKYVGIMNHYLYFFSSSIQAHWIAMMIGIWNLIDEKNLSLISLYKNLCHESKIGKDLQIEIDNKFESVSHSLKGIKIMRHNIIAHISKNINYDETFDKANIKYNDIKDVIIELGNIYNLICLSIGENQVAFWVKARLDKPGEFSENDIKRLLNDLLKFNKSN